MEREKGKQRAGKGIFIFFACMFGCTIISSVAASATVPTVTCENAGRGRLNFVAEGDGKLTADTLWYADVEEGLEVEETNVLPGSSVKAGDLLFRYGEESIKKAQEKAKKEMEAAKSEYELECLSQSKKTETAGTFNESQMLEDANEALLKAEQAYKEAEKAYQKKMERIDKAVKEEREKAIEAAEDAVKTAKESYLTTEEEEQKLIKEARAALEDAIDVKAEALQEAEKALTTAKEAGSKANEGIDRIVEALTAYGDAVNAKDYANMDARFTTLLQACFGEEELTRLKVQIKEKEALHQQADAAYRLLKANWEAEEKELLDDLQSYETDTDEYAAALKAYKLTKTAKESEISAAYAASVSANAEYELTAKEYKSITEAAAGYEAAVAGQDTGEETKKFKSLYDAVIKTAEDGKSTREEATKEISRCEENLAAVTNRQEKLVARAEEKVTELEAEMKEKLKKGQQAVEKAEKTYDAVIKKEFANEEETEAAYLALKAAKETKEEAERAKEKAEENLSEANRSEQMNRENAEIDGQMEQIKLAQLKEALKEKEEKYGRYEAILKENGEVRAEKDGTVTKVEVKEHQETSGTEEVAVATDQCVFTGICDAEKAEHIEEGDEITVKLSGRTKKIKGVVTKKEYNLTDDQYTITASLPEGTYTAGIGGTYTILKQTESYDYVIPIEALRFDGKQYYVLYVTNQESILGDIMVAAKMNVTVEEKDADSAVISDPLSSDMRLITKSSRNIEEGDRIRFGD
ncbi:MAG: hypothetical protein E7256_17005 [Lachnospiraceae bacterium]|nr:hypothetical protein [Lachnospiraceae bacterium]